MNCEKVQSLLARDLRGEAKPDQASAIRGHLAECAACREWLAFHRSLDTQLDVPVALPQGLEAKTVALVLEPAGRGAWFTRVLGNTTMKKLAISTSTLAILAIGAMTLIPRPANASTPIESFKKVRSALTRSALQGEVTVKAIADKDGALKTEVSVNGVVLTDLPIKTEVQRFGDDLEAHITIDLDQESYQVIRFGKDNKTLELVRKNEPKKLHKVKLDPQTQAPIRWSSEPIVVEGFPIDVNSAGAAAKGQVVEGFQLDPKDIQPSAKVVNSQSKQILDVHMKLKLGTSATAKVAVSS